MPIPDEFALPEAKIDAIVREFGDRSRPWIDGFPELLARLIDRWALTLKGVAPAGFPINMTYFAETAAGEAVVLKVGHPHPEQRTEMIALSKYAGRHVPRLIDASAVLGAILMERVSPGSTFRAWGNSIERSKVPLDIFGKLPMKGDGIEGLPTFDEWIERAFREFRQKFGENHDFFAYIELAETSYAAMKARHPESWLLHGDLHHENILLDSARGWLAIDPKGVIGPKPMECGRFLHNFMEDEIAGVLDIDDANLDQLCEVLEARLTTFERTLGMPRSELACAAFVDATLSFCWTINSGLPWRDDVRRVDAARRMLAHYPV